MANPLITNFDYAKLFIGDNVFDTGTYTNSTGSEVTLAEGTIVARITATQAIGIYDSSASNGLEYPLGVLKEEHTVANGSSETLTYCISGRVTSDLLVFPNSETLNTQVVLVGTDNDSPPNDINIPLGIVRDVLQRSGLQIVSRTENTAIDNPQS